MEEIKQLVTKEELLEGFSVMKELRSHLEVDEYFSLLKSMIKEGYKMFGLYHSGRIVAVAGVCIMTNLYHGRHVFIYDLVTTERERSKNYGAKLLRFIEKWGAEQGAKAIALTSGLQRLEAHRFYEKKMNFERTSFAFKKGI
ncbi:GNAT family N-acetyltransferase [Bacillus massilinigeriensis]|uniref:GNAT family N-acetyltransferase n=1 Tax=Bacillus massilionigeriensis TaxID=1805475 RepID=UPI00096B2089|nr:GNAT family N-acetyltransferase [Bacillus massilionigeriensis]